MSGAKRGVCLLVLYYHGGGNNHNNNCKERAQKSKQFAPLLALVGGGDHRRRRRRLPLKVVVCNKEWLVAELLEIEIETHRMSTSDVSNSNECAKVIELCRDVQLDTHLYILS